MYLYQQQLIGVCASEDALIFIDHIINVIAHKIPTSEMLK